MLREAVNRLMKDRACGRIFRTLNYCLYKELESCQTVLDLGCGPSSPLKYCENIKRSVGIEGFEPYFKKAKDSEIHTEYINKKIEEMDFSENSFDAVIMIDVIEHMTEEAAYGILKKAEKWARKKVIVTTPNGFLRQRQVDGNPLQQHLSGWGQEKMAELGYGCRGLAGLKALRAMEYAGDTKSDDITMNIRFHPKFFWFMVAALSQIYAYRFPRSAYSLFCVKQLRKA